MSELALTLVRLGFLTLLWAFVLITVLALRRDLRRISDAQRLPVGAKPGEHEFAGGRRLRWRQVGLRNAYFAAVHW